MATEHDTLIEALQAGHMEIVQLRAKVAAKDAEIERLDREMGGLWASLDKRTEERDVTTAEKHEAEAAEQRANEEIERLKREVRLLESEMGNATGDWRRAESSLSAAKQRNEQLEGALELAINRPMPHGGRWHRKPHVREGCVGCVLEDALAPRYLASSSTPTKLAPAEAANGPPSAVSVSATPPPRGVQEGGNSSKPPTTPAPGDDIEKHDSEVRKALWKEIEEAARVRPLGNLLRRHLPFSRETIDGVRKLAAEARDAALEEAAQVAESFRVHVPGSDWDHMATQDLVARNIGLAIRSLKSSAPPEPKGPPTLEKGFCPKRADETHCEHWWDEEPCCDCGHGAAPTSLPKGEDPR